MNSRNSTSVERVSFSAAEFARRCGRHPSWAYRLAYAGKIKVVTEFGRMMIPASELERLVQTAAVYSPTERPPAKPKKKSRRRLAAKFEPQSADDIAIALNDLTNELENIRREFVDLRARLVAIEQHVVSGFRSVAELTSTCDAIDRFGGIKRDEIRRAARDARAQVSAETRE